MYVFISFRKVREELKEYKKKKAQKKLTRLQVLYGVHPILHKTLGTYNFPRCRKFQSLESMRNKDGKASLRR